MRKNDRDKTKKNTRERVSVKEGWEVLGIVRKRKAVVRITEKAGGEYQTQPYQQSSSLPSSITLSILDRKKKAWTNITLY
jgi:hypothetical protein